LAEEGVYQSLEGLLNAKSIAIIGASRDQNKLSGRLLSYIINHGYSGKIYPVNPKEVEIQGLQCYPSIEDVPGPVDLACLMVPAAAIPETLDRCGKCGAKAAIIGASGFAEIGEEGEKIQKGLVDIARRWEMRIAGPNSIGICNFVNNIFASFSMSLDFPKIVVGNISFVSQSGAMGGSMLSRGWERGIGFSRFISSGNEADVQTADYIRFLVKDPNTRVIASFIEGVKNADQFKLAAEEALRAKKPIIAFKNGRTEVGHRAVKSHTGMLAGSYEVYKYFFQQYGVIHVEEISELFNVAWAFATQPLPRGKRVGIVSTSGGGCSIVADECVRFGLEVPDFTPSTEEKLAKIIPSFGAFKNPMDTTAHILAQPGMYRGALQTVLNDDNIDVVVMMLSTIAEPAATKMASDIVDVVKESDKPLVVTWTIAETLASNGMKILRENGIPMYERPESAVYALSKMVWYNQKLKELEM